MYEREYVHPKHPPLSPPLNPFIRRFRTEATDILYRKKNSLPPLTLAHLLQCLSIKTKSTKIRSANEQEGGKQWWGEDTRKCYHVLREGRHKSFGKYTSSHSTFVRTQTRLSCSHSPSLALILHLLNLFFHLTQSLSFISFHLFLRGICSSSKDCSRAGRSRCIVR